MPITLEEDALHPTDCSMFSSNPSVIGRAPLVESLPPCVQVTVCVCFCVCVSIHCVWRDDCLWYILCCCVRVQVDSGVCATGFRWLCGE